MRYLTSSPRSCWEVRQQLLGRGFCDETASAAETRLLELGILDDREFARAWVERAVLRRHDAPATVQPALTARGVPSEIIGDALAELLLDETNVDAAMAAASERLRTLHGPDVVVRRRLWAFLARRGYEGEVVAEVCSRLLGDCALDESDGWAANAGPWGSSVR